MSASSPTQEDKKASFGAALDIVKLFTTLSTGALAFSIGLTAQATDNYPLPAKIAVLVAMVIFLGSIGAGIWAQGISPRLLLGGNADPNATGFRLPALLAVLAFALGVVVVSLVLLATVPFGAPGQRIVVTSPTAALARALTVVDVKTVAKVAATELLHGTDAVRPDRSAWHVQFELKPKGGADPQTVDVYVDPVRGCATVLQRMAASSTAPACLGLPPTTSFR
jgi:hypothetical protein